MVPTSVTQVAVTTGGAAWAEEAPRAIAAITTVM